MKTLFVFLTLVFAGAAFAGRQHLESWYADALASELKAKSEVRMPDGTRCDVLSSTHAIEVEFAAKWCEAVGQSLNYSSHTGRPGAIALIVEKESDVRFLNRLRALIKFHRLPLEVVVMKPFHRDGLEFQFTRNVRPPPDFTTKKPLIP